MLVLPPRVVLLALVLVLLQLQVAQVVALDLLALLVVPLALVLVLALLVALALLAQEEVAVRRVLVCLRLQVLPSCHLRLPVWMSLPSPSFHPSTLSPGTHRHCRIQQRQ